MDDELFQDFLAESYENLENLNRNLIALEKDPSQKEILASIFRTLHTIKGTCGFFGLKKLERITHLGENILTLLRENVFTLTPEIITHLLKLADSIRLVLNHLKTNQSEGDDDFQELILALTSIHEPKAESLETASLQEDISSEPIPSEPKKETVVLSLYNKMGGKESLSIIVEEFQKYLFEDSELKPFFTQIILNENISWFREKLLQFFIALFTNAPLPLENFTKIHHRFPIRESHFQRFLNHFRKTLASLGISKELIDEASPYLAALSENILQQDNPSEISPPTTRVRRTPEPPSALKPLSSTTLSKEVFQQEPKSEVLVSGKDTKELDGSDWSIRVEVKLLNKLMNLVGELVLTRNQLLQKVTLSENSSFANISQRLNSITAELQEGVMKTRMQPIRTILAKMERMIRDVALSCRKEIKFEVYGQETELDKTIIESIKDPIIHLLRNAVDHGIESREERLSLGKTPEGKITIHAFHKGGQVYIEIVDDGQGIHPEKLKQHALKIGILDPKSLHQMTDREAINLIFLPGFSTAQEVTTVSGRGVGMNVVKTNLEKIGGTLEIQSEVHKETLFRLKLPLTLAIIPALMILCEGNFYAIPQANCLELIYIDPEQVAQEIKLVQNVPVYQLREKLLPLIYLEDALQGKGSSPQIKKNKAHSIVVFQANDSQIGMVVDEIQDTHEIVVKRLGKQLTHLIHFSGATIMGDGCVALILDLSNIALASGLLSDKKQNALQQEDSLLVAKKSNAKELLLFKMSSRGMMGISLDTLSRLEEIPCSQVERRFNQQEVVQYRGRIMPLVHLSSLFEKNPRKKEAEGPSAKLQVLVYSGSKCYVGIVVEQILDIIQEETIVQEHLSEHPCISGTVVVQGKIIDLIHPENVIRMTYPELIDYNKTSV